MRKPHSVFVVPPIYDDSYYGFRIHEITEMQVAGCFRIADKELVEACNQALADMKADGTLYDLAVKYLSQDVADSLDVFTK